MNEAELFDLELSLLLLTLKVCSTGGVPMNCCCTRVLSLRERLNEPLPLTWGSSDARACAAPSRVARRPDSAAANCGSLSRASS